MASLLIGPYLDAVKACLATVTPAFGRIRIGDAAPIASLEAFVLPVKTDFPNEGEGSTRGQVHEILVRLAVTGTDPEALTQLCLQTVQAVDAALEDWTAWPLDVPSTMYAFVAGHNYGPMFQKGAGLAYWPEITLRLYAVEVS